MDDVKIRRLRGPDCHLVIRFINEILRQEEGIELKKQIKKLFLHPSLWLLSALLICIIGIYFEYIFLNSHMQQNNINFFSFPPIPTSCAVLLGIWTWGKVKFQSYWSEAKKCFRASGDDLNDLYKFYCLSSKRKRMFLLAEINDQIIGTIAIREAPGMPELARTSKCWRLYIHPEFRRLGVASRLIKESLKLCYDLGYTRVAVRTHENNEAAIRLFDKNGFRLVSSDVLAQSYPLKFNLLDFEISELTGSRKQEEEENNGQHKNKDV